MRNSLYSPFSQPLTHQQTAAGGQPTPGGQVQTGNWGTKVVRLSGARLPGFVNQLSHLPFL